MLSNNNNNDDDDYYDEKEQLNLNCKLMVVIYMKENIKLIIIITC